MSQEEREPSGRQNEGGAKEGWAEGQVWRLRGPQQGLFNITLQVKEDCMEEVPLELKSDEQDSGYAYLKERSRTQR